jgi:GAF domain-containing protein
MTQVTGLDRRLLGIYSELSGDRLMELVVEYARDRLDALGSSIFLRDDITGRYVLRGTTGILESGERPTGRVEYEIGEGLTGWIVKHGRPLRIVNVKDKDELHRIADDLVWSKKYSEISAEAGLPYLGVPILAAGGTTVVGMLRVSGKAGGEAFNEQAEALLSHVAATVYVAIENSRRYERERRRARYFRLLLGINSQLDPRLPIPEMLQRVVDHVREGFRTESCQVYLRPEDDVHRVVLRAASGLPAALIGGLSCEVGEGLTGHIVQNGATLQVREAAKAAEWGDPHVAEIGPHLPSGTVRSFIGVPLRLGDEILGALELVNKIPSAPGHRDWFTDDDEEYLLVLCTAIGGVLEGARYLQALNDVGVTAMRMQRVASFGTLAQRIRHEAANPLAVARLAVTNLRLELEGASGEALALPEGEQDVESSKRLQRRLDIIEASLSEVSDKLLDLLKFSQRIGFIRKTTNWNDVVHEVLIWLASERQRRSVEIHAHYGDLPPLFIEPNELFGVLVTLLRVAMETVPAHGGTVAIETAPCASGRGVYTKVRVPEAVRSPVVACILEPATGVPEELSPLHFEWALAQETVDTQYGGSLVWEEQEGALQFLLELPQRELP